MLTLYIFTVECRQISLLPTEDIEFSTIYSGLSTMDVWCAVSSDSSPNADITFTESVYLLYAVVRGTGIYYVTEFSLTYENSSGESVTYMNVDGDSVRYFIIKLAV